MFFSELLESVSDRTCRCADLAAAAHRRFGPSDQIPEHVARLQVAVPDVDRRLDSHAIFVSDRTGRALPRIDLSGIRKQFLGSTRVGRRNRRSIQRADIS